MINQNKLISEDQKMDANRRLNDRYNQCETEVIFDQQQILMWENILNMHSKNAVLVKTAEVYYFKLIKRITFTLQHFENIKIIYEKNIKNKFKECIANIHELRDPDKEEKILNMVKRLPEDMVKVIAEFCPEIEYQKRLIKHEYITNMIDKNIGNIMLSWKKKKLSKLWCFVLCKNERKNLRKNHPMKDPELQNFVEDIRINKLEKKCNDKNIYNRTTKERMLDIILQILHLSRYNNHRNKISGSTQKEYVNKLWEDKYSFDTAEVYSIIRAIQVL